MILMISFGSMLGIHSQIFIGLLLRIFFLN